MNEQDRRVIGGVDAHAETHHAAALDDRGALLGTRSFEVSAAGYRELVAWLRSFGEIDRVGVESTGSYAAGLTRHLIADSVRVLEVNQPHAHTRRRRGKTDAIDAELAARHALSLSNPVVPKHTTGIVEAIRQLRVARESAVKSRSVATVQLGDLILTAPQRPARAARGSQVAQGQGRALPPPASRRRRPADWRREVRIAKPRAPDRRPRRRDRRTRRQLGPLVATAAPRTTALLGISTGHAGQLMVTAGENIERLTSEGAFAALCGESPIPVASGKRGRYRLNPGGDRQANRALHLIAVCRLRYCPRTRAYAARRATEGKTKKEIMRCLKRYIARELYRSLRGDLADLATRPTQPPTTRPTVAVSISCGAGFIGRHRRTEAAP